MRKLIPFGITAASFLIFFARITSFPLRNWDEAWYAEIIKNMASGKYGILMPYWNGRYYFDHAPLYFWLSTPIVKLFGAGEWQIRTVSALSAVFATLLIFLIGKKLADIKTGFIAVIVFLSLGQVVSRFAHGNLDATLIALFLASFWLYLKSENSKIFSILCGISLGVGMLVKSWGVGIFPIFLIFAYVFSEKKPLLKNTLLILTSILLATSWWYLWGILTFKETFISWYLLSPSEGRLQAPLANFSLYYFSVLFRDIGFWFIPIGVSLALNFKQIIKKEKWILSFIGVTLLYIFSLNFLKDKSDWYNLPTYPLVAIVTALFIKELAVKNFRFTFLLTAGIFLLQLILVYKIENTYPDRSKVGAELGLFAQAQIPAGSTIILDDQDFTSFLFYSNQNAIFTLEDDQESTFTEWWKVKHSSLVDFLSKNDNVWIVTPNKSLIDTNYIDSQIVYHNYYFFKIKNPKLIK